MEKNGKEDEMYLEKRQSDGENNGEIPFEVGSSDHGWILNQITSTQNPRISYTLMIRWLLVDEFLRLLN